jgi:hypothetical protein
VSLDQKQLRELEGKIVDGTTPPCPLCGDRLAVGKKQEGHSGAIGFQYRCSNRNCQLPPGHAYHSWHVVFARALQKRAVQLVLAAVGSITISGVVGLATGLINWTSRPPVAPSSLPSDVVALKYYPDSNEFLKNRDNGLFNSISQSKDEIWFVGIAFHTTLSDGDLRKLILQKILSGVKVKFLIYDPTSSDVPLVAKQWGRDETKNVVSDCETSIRYLREMYETIKSTNFKNNLEVKLYREIPLSRLYIFDPRDVKSHTYFVPHIGQSRSPELPGYVLSNESIAKEYYDAIVSLWSNDDPSIAVSLEDWLQRAETKHAANKSK